MACWKYIKIKSVIILRTQTTGGIFPSTTQARRMLLQANVREWICHKILLCQEFINNGTWWILGHHQLYRWWWCPNTHTHHSKARKYNSLYILAIITTETVNKEQKQTEYWKRGHLTSRTTSQPVIWIEEGECIWSGNKRRWVVRAVYTI